ncbi:MAG: peptidase M3, partial [Bacteroidales bacterium]|nr:peptidase M3 [Bacteroidales bacterium]
MKKLLFAAMTFAAVVSCQNKNPLLKEWDAPFGIAPFSEILPEHYREAIPEAIKAHKAEIEAIATNPEAPTFENTVEALDRSGELIGRIYAVLGSETNINSNDEINAVEEEFLPIVSEYSTRISLDERLFNRVKAVYDQRESLNLRPD